MKSPEQEMVKNLTQDEHTICKNSHPEDAPEFQPGCPPECASCLYPQSGIAASSGSVSANPTFSHSFFSKPPGPFLRMWK